MTRNDDHTPVPLPTVRRLPRYLRLLRRYQALGRAVVSGTSLARELNVESIQVRKDLSWTGIVGRPGVGFPVTDTIRAIERFLHWDTTSDAVLVGAGHLGTALLGFDDFGRYGLHIVAAFDSDPERIGQVIHGRTVHPMAKLVDFALERRLAIGILTVSASAAQVAAADLIAAGIRAIWNFTPATLDVPEGVIAQDEDITAGLAELFVLSAAALKKNE